jgi:hypothetical protein
MDFKDKQIWVDALDKTIVCFPNRVLSLLIFDYLQLPPVQFAKQCSNEFVCVTPSTLTVTKFSDPWIWVHSDLLLQNSSHSWTFASTSRAPFYIGIAQSGNGGMGNGGFESKRGLFRYFNEVYYDYIHIHINFTTHCIVFICIQNATNWFATEVNFADCMFKDQELLSFFPCVAVGYLQSIEIISALPFKLSKQKDPKNLNFNRWHGPIQYLPEKFLSYSELLARLCYL